MPDSSKTPNKKPAHIRVVGGTITDKVEGDYIINSETNIINNAATIVAQSGDENGVSYNKAENVEVSIKKKTYLYLLFYIDEDHKGRLMISEAAQTRLKNIKNLPWYDDDMYKAFCIPLQAVDEIIEQVKLILEKHTNDEYEALISEVGVFSHAGGDGPISYNKAVETCPIEWPHQMDLCGWEEIEFKWNINAKCVFYGCNTGNNGGMLKKFAENISKLSNFHNVRVWGQSTSSFPSFYPHYRVTSVARSLGDNGTGWDIRGNTYQVGGNAGEGRKAISYRPDKNTLTAAEIIEGGYPKANPFNIYLNGSLLYSNHQGIFNNHLA